MRAAAAMYGVVFWNVLGLRRFIPAADLMMWTRPHKFVYFSTGLNWLLIIKFWFGNLS